MAHSGKTKTRILHLLKILQEETDAEHGLTMAQIIKRLGDYGIPAERKSVYSDIRALREFDVNICTHRCNPVEYAIERQNFTLRELMLVVDAIQSCRAITDRQARLLVTNVKQLASNHEQALLDRRIHVEGRIKSKSDSVLCLVDSIHEAMRLHCRMEFAYRKIGPDGKPYETNKGRKHEVTPVGVSYDDGFYYLTAWDERHSSIAEYRLDRMVKLRLLENAPATRNKEISRHRHGADKATMFGHFGGEEVVATLEASADKAEIITDRFGDAATFLPPDGPQARAYVRICKSEQFFGWIASMGKAVRIAAPKSLVEEYRNYLRYLLED